MADDLYPRSERPSANGLGAINDLEHEILWSVFGEGLLPGQAANALEVSISGSNWVCQPGKMLIAGHVFTNDSVKSEALPGGSPGGTKRCLVVARIDRTTAPWTFGIALVNGTPGAGRPGLQRSNTTVWEVSLGAIDVASNSALSLAADDREYVSNAGLNQRPTVEAVQTGDLTVDQESWFSPPGNECALYFKAPPTGRVWVDSFVYGQASNTAHALLAGFGLWRTATGSTIYQPTVYDGPVITTRAAFSVGRAVTGLVPGETYYAWLAIRAAEKNFAVTAYQRRLAVRPD